MKRVPDGFSLVELILALALLGTVTAALVALVLGVQRLARAEGERVELAETLRIATTVLAGELRLIDPAADIGGLAPDAVALRAFRGAGVVCAGSDAEVLVRYRGLRDPEPEKDSVLVLGPDGVADRPLRLEFSAQAPGACRVGEGEEAYRWRLAVAPPPGTPVLLYETGSYHLAARALRYRRGSGGRQPITPDVVEEGASGFRLLPEGESGGAPALALEVRLAVRARGAAAEPGRPLRRVARFRLSFLNRP